MTLRPYQLFILNAIREGWQKYRRQLVVSPTGSGKTIIFSSVTQEFVGEGKRVLALVDQKELVDQTVDKMHLTASIRCDVERAEFRARPEAQVVCATIQTMARRMTEWAKDHFDLVIADEADKSISPQWQSVLKYFDAKTLGVTATPHRTDLRNLGEFYENTAADISLGDLLPGGRWAFDLDGDQRVPRHYLSPITIQMLPIVLDVSQLKTGSDGDYKPAQLHDVIAPHLEKIAEAIRDKAIFRRTLGFLPLIATSEKMTDICRSIGLNAEHIDGDSPDRKEKLERFARGDIDVLWNSSLMLRGVDIPPIDCIAMLRPTKSVTLYQQSVGRGTRLHPGKTDLLLFDFLYQAQKKMVCRPAHLIAKTEEEAESITTVATAGAMPGDIAAEMPVDLLELASDAQQQREEALRKKLEAHKNKKAATISAEEFALRYKSLATAEYEPTMFWEMAPPSDRQKKVLKQAGIDIGTVKGVAHASKLIEIYFREKPLRMASPAVLKAINRSSYTQGIARDIGITDLNCVTHDQGRKFFAALNKRKEPQFA